MKWIIYCYKIALQESLNYLQFRLDKEKSLDQSHKIAQIKWACRRGMLELDFILNEFLDHGFADLSENEQNEFQDFLENDDPDLYSWLMGFRQPKLTKDILMVKKIIAPQK